MTVSLIATQRPHHQERSNRREARDWIRLWSASYYGIERASIANRGENASRISIRQSSSDKCPATTIDLTETHTISVNIEKRPVFGTHIKKRLLTGL
jgi:hypothetical protein